MIAPRRVSHALARYRGDSLRSAASFRHVGTLMMRPHIRFGVDAPVVGGRSAQGWLQGWDEAIQQPVYHPEPDGG
jgi:hypothetical protein